jgi:hypothetical protein
MIEFIADFTRLEYRNIRFSSALKALPTNIFIERIVRADIQDHFDKAQGPLEPWQVSYASIRRNDPKRPTLTRTRALRFGLQYKFTSNGLEVRPSKVTADYAWTHQLGLKVDLFGKYPYQFPVRKYAYLSKKANKQIIDTAIQVLINA